MQLLPQAELDGKGKGQEKSRKGVPKNVKHSPGPHRGKLTPRSKEAMIWRIRPQSLSYCLYLIFN